MDGINGICFQSGCTYWDVQNFIGKHILSNSACGGCINHWIDIHAQSGRLTETDGLAVSGRVNGSRN